MCDNDNLGDSQQATKDPACASTSSVPPLTFSVGLVGVSIQISFVFGVMAASSAATLVRSTKSNVMPDAACTMRLEWRNARHP